MAAFDPDPLIHQTTRLQILGALYRNRRLAYTTLRDALGLTDGNLGAHLERLSTAGYTAVREVLGATGFRKVYEITPLGATAFRDYLDELAAFLTAHADAETRPTADSAR